LHLNSHPESKKHEGFSLVLAKSVENSFNGTIGLYEQVALELSFSEKLRLIELFPKT
jgi:hypothetical protein